MTSAAPRDWRRTVLTAGPILATAFVAATAFVLAYGGSKGAALDAGMSNSAAGWYPLCIEGVIVVASLSTVVLPRGERLLGWSVLLGFTALSAAANVLHALDHDGHKWWSPGFAVVPPLALPLCVRLAERVALSARTAAAPALDNPPAAELDSMRAELDEVRRSALDNAAGPTLDSLRTGLLDEVRKLSTSNPRQRPVSKRPAKPAVQRPQRSPEYSEAVRRMVAAGVSRSTANHRAGRAEGQGTLPDLLAEYPPVRVVTPTPDVAGAGLP